MAKKIRPLHMLSSGVSLQIKRYTQTESKGMEKDISRKWQQANKQTKSWGGNTYSRQNKL